jgi:serine/threonine protein kinase
VRHGRHAVAVLHRDVTPHNVLIAADDRVVLTDFGLAFMSTRPISAVPVQPAAARVAMGNVRPCGTACSAMDSAASSLVHPSLDAEQ